MYSDIPVRERRRSCAVVLSSLAVVAFVKAPKLAFHFSYALMIYVLSPPNVTLDKYSQCKSRCEIGTRGQITYHMHLGNNLEV